MAGGYGAACISIFKRIFFTTKDAKDAKKKRDFE